VDWIVRVARAPKSRGRAAVLPACQRQTVFATLSHSLLGVGRIAFTCGRPQDFRQGRTGKSKTGRFIVFSRIFTTFPYGAMLGRIRSLIARCESSSNIVHLAIEDDGAVESCATGSGREGTGVDHTFQECSDSNYSCGPPLFTGVALCV
jgi:hypothetical protein